MASVVTHQAAGLDDRCKATARGRGRTARVVGLISGKGGVGKSALAVNLALGAARDGHRVLLVDADAGLANTDLLMGLIPEFDLDDWTRGECSSRDLLCPAPHGLSLLLSGNRVESLENLRESLHGRGPGPLRKILDTQDLVVVDLGAGVSDAVLDLARACGLIWLVATPEPTSLADAYATTKKLFERSPELSIELIVNRYSGAASAARTHEALDRLCQRFLGRSLPLRGCVPEDPALVRSVALQSPVILGRERSEAARRVALLAESLLEEGLAIGAGGEDGSRGA